MNIIKKVFNKITYIKTDRYVKFKQRELQKVLLREPNKPRIYFFCTPTHSNLGDQAQLFCWLRLLKEWHPGHEVVCVPTRYRSFATIRTIHKNLQKPKIRNYHPIHD